MAVTENFFTGDGSTTSYVLTFEYIDEDDVKVSLDGSVTTEYSFANATTILFDTAPADQAEIRIYRDTDIDTLKSTFFAGSSIRAQDLNQNFEQNNFAVQEIKAYTWDNEIDTIHSDETWVSDDTKIATTAAMDARFQDEVNDTLTKAELAALSDVIPDNDDAVPTTGAVKDYVDHVIETDILVDGTGLNKTGSSGQVTLGISANSVDFDRIKDSDIITDTEQDAGSPAPGNTNIFTALGAARRFDTIVSQTEQSTAVNWEVGKTWLQNDAEKTVRIWDGSAWVAVASGGAFTTLPKVVYVDAVNGDDTLEGHRISNPKRTIKAAIEQINAETDEVGDGSVVIVAPGVYQETAPIDIEKRNVSIIGQALRSCIVHPTSATEENTLFRLNSGSYIANLTLTGVKASGTRGGNALDTNATHGLPTNQGWNFAFFPNATIVKSPYIANCTNFSDSEIDNDDLNAFNPRGGLGGDTDSAPTGGGILIDGSVVDSSSPLRSIVCDSYTHVGLDGPGIFVTNNGYCQATSSYAFFTHYHIKALNGGQANLAASTSDFGRFGLIAEGRSSSAIFTASTTANASSGATTFTINAPTAATGWHGSATRPQANMVVDVGGNTYSIISATANGTGWDVEISRPDPNNLSTNLGLNGSVASGSAVSFFLRSMIASSGHTMEYVGSGTNYSALPENGGVPVEANEIVEVSDGKVWAATTNHQGKFTVGPTFNVDQVTGYVNIANGAIGIEQLIENLDLNSFTLSDSTGDVTIDDQLDMNTHKIVNVVDPTGAQDAATKNYVDTSSANTNYVAVTGDSMTGDLNMSSNTVTGLGAPSAASDAATKSYVDAVDTAKLDKAGGTMTGDLTMNAQSDIKFADSDSSNWVAVQAPATIGTNYTLTLPTSVGNAGEALITDAGGNLSWSSNVATVVDQIIEGDTKVEATDTGTDGTITFTTDGTTAMTVDSNQRVGIGTTSPASILHCASSGDNNIRVVANSQTAQLGVDAGTPFVGTPSGAFNFYANGSTAATLDSSGRLGIGTTSPVGKLDIDGGSSAFTVQFKETSGPWQRMGIQKSNNLLSFGEFNNTGDTFTPILNVSGDGDRVGIGTTSPDDYLTIADTSTTGDIGLRFKGDASSRQFIMFGDPGGAQLGDIMYDHGTDAMRFRVNNSERARIDSSGRVGIGTSSPGFPFQVKSTTDAHVAIWDNGGIPQVLGVNDAGGSAQLRLAGQILSFTGSGGAGSEHMRLDASGRLGIGTTSPSYKCDIDVTGSALRLNSTTSQALLVISSDDAANAKIEFGDESDNDRGAITYDNPNNALIFQANAAERARIDSSGNVGIGTTSPGAKLDVNGKTIVGSDSSNALEVFSSGDTEIGFSYSSKGNIYAKIIGDITNASPLAGELAFQTATGGSLSERARIDSSGRLLVNTTSNIATGTGDKVQVAETVGANIILGRNDTVVTDSNNLGQIAAYSFHGSSWNESARIQFAADGAHAGSGDVPGRISFQVCKDGVAGVGEQMQLDNAGNLKFNSGYGSAATAYGVRAWCYGDLVGTIAIHESGGVTSLTDSANGQFIVNFSFTFPDVNYAVTGTATDGTGEANFLSVRTSGTNPVRSTSAISMEIYTYQGGRIDAEFGLAVFR